MKLPGTHTDQYLGCLHFQLINGIYFWEISNIFIKFRSKLLDPTLLTSFPFFSSNFWIVYDF